MARVSPLVFVPPIIFAGLVAMFYWGMGRGDPGDLRSIREGSVVPTLQLGQLGEQKPFGIDVLKQPGVKLVNFWASWCAPCRVEHPNLIELSEQGIQIYGINYKDDPKKALAFLESLGDPFARIAADSDGRSALDWGVYGVPETYVIDSNGIVVLRFAGPITQRVLREKVKPAIQSAN